MAEISWQRERRDSRRIGAESLGETNAAAEGRRFLGGKEWGETAMGGWRNKFCFGYPNSFEKWAKNEELEKKLGILRFLFLFIYFYFFGKLRRKGLGQMG